MAYRKLGRNSSARKALFKSILTSFFKHERIETTEAKAKEISGLADQLITLAKRGDLSARRQAIAQLADEDVVRKLFTDIVNYDSVKNRQGGYTRTLKLGVRRGDAAPMVILELVNNHRYIKRLLLPIWRQQLFLLSKKGKMNIFYEFSLTNNNEKCYQ